MTCASWMALVLVGVALATKKHVVMIVVDDLGWNGAWRRNVELYFDEDSQFSIVSLVFMFLY